MNAPVIQRIPAIINGISRQAPTMRHPTACADAENVSFSVVDGFSKRAGSEYIARIDGGSRTVEYRMHKFERDEDLEFAVIYGPGVFTIMNLNTGVTITPTISDVANSYITYASPNATDLKLVTIADATFVLNKKRTPACEGIANETIDATRMPMLLVRNSDGTWDMDSRTWNERPKGQQIIVNGETTATGGNFKIQYKGVTSANIPYDATASDIDDILEDMDTIGAGKAQCFGGPIHKHNVHINLSPDLIELEDMVVTASSVIGSTYTIQRGDDLTNSAPKIIRDSLGINDISYYRNRLILAGDEYVVFSQTDDLFNFYYFDSGTVIDSDPIEVALAANDVTVVDSVQPHGDTIIILTTAGQQFQLNGTEILAPATASITPSTRYETQPIRPVTMGDSIYFAGNHKQYTIMYEYTYNQDLISYRANDITKHCFDLIPPSMVSLRASLNNDTLVVVPRNDINEAATVFTSLASGDWHDNTGDKWGGGSGSYNSPQEWDTAIIDDETEITFHGTDDDVATGTVVFSGTQTPGQIITIQDTAGLSKAYLAATAQDLTTNPPKFDCDGTAAAQATSLKACIESAYGHPSTITVADNLSGTLTLTQTIYGEAGNNSISEDCTNVAVTGFVNGADNPLFTDGYANVGGQVKTTAGDSTIYVYRRYQKGQELLQSAWVRWSFGTDATADNIMDCIIVDNDLFVLTRDDEQGATADNTALLLWKLSLTEERVADTGFDFKVMLDHKHSVSAYTSKSALVDGVYTYTYTIPWYDLGVNTVVLSDDWADNSGTVITASGATPDSSGNRIVTFTTAFQPYDVLESKVMVGRSYNGEVELSPIFMRGKNDMPVSEGKTILQKVIVDHYKAGPYKIVITDTSAVNRADSEYSFTPSSGHSEEYGSLTAWLHARPRDTKISIKITEPKPCTISALEYHGHFGSLLEGMA